MSETVAGVPSEHDKPRTSGAGSWLRWTVAAVFGLLYAYAIWLALFIFIAASSAQGSGLTGLGVVVMLLPVAFPVLIYLAAIVIGRRMWVWRQALIFLAGLGLVAVFWLDVVMFQVAAQSSLVAA
ncbi:hypothetical protein [Microbacterium gorillae]|uniref:hypothetical protein n=1 Tax=Microbacterium gorillae TaxID=1231063 RepID=UPI000693A24E|nr:hypothetical protein [Microbacterium gorillae]